LRYVFTLSDKDDVPERAKLPLSQQRFAGRLTLPLADENLDSFHKLA
jgi:hypothetical protein